MPAAACGLTPVALIMLKYSYRVPARITNAVKMNEYGWSQNPPRTKITMKIPVNVRRKRFSKF
jgi:hypothetical protein